MFRSIKVATLGLLTLSIATTCVADEPVAPSKSEPLFNGKDLTGLVSWLKASGHEDPENVFTVEEGVIHMKGDEHRGYLATEKSFRDYHVSVEYKWGKQTDGGKYVRNSGLLLHGTGAHGGASGVWMPSIEVQLAQGCEGDLIVIRGKDKNDETIKVDLTSNTRKADDGRTRYDPNGTPTRYSGRQFWWSKHQVGFKELLDTRGSDDVASPVGEWTRVDCICAGDRITVKINGETVNECYYVHPAGGHILLQDEGHEVYFRNFMIGPVDIEK